ncbi:MAG: C40 family peptidase [Eubacterium sp.]|nr:C40 family peptidase [Eubacterium sp.]
MDIKKVDDKPMIIHTKKQSKLHIHGKKKSNLTSSKSEQIENNKHPKRWKILDQLDESGRSIKTKNSDLHIKAKTGVTYLKGVGEIGVDVAADNLEGGDELRDAVNMADTVITPVTDTTKGGMSYAKSTVDRARYEYIKRKIKKQDISKKIIKDRIKKVAKKTAKKTASDAAKETSKEVAKETAKTAGEIAAQIAAQTAAEVATETTVETVGATVGTAAGPEGTLLGFAAGAAIGHEVGKEVGRSIEKADAKASIRLRKIRWFIDKTKAEEEQKDSLVKMIRDVVIRDIIMRIRTIRTQTVMIGAFFLSVYLSVAIPIIAIIAIIYNSPLAVFFPSPDTGTDDIRTVLCSYYMDFNQQIISLEEGGNEITYQNTKNEVPVSNFNDTLMVYMVLYSDGKAGYVMDKDGKKNLKKVFDEMNYIDNKSTTTEKTCGDSIGKVWVTAYCPCTICCGPNANGITASGKKATAKHTIAVDAYNPIVPMGTNVIIEGVEYTVEDTGDLNHYGNDFDIFYAKHEDCNQWGRKNVEAYLAEGNANKVKVTTSGTTVHNLTYQDYINKKTLNEDQEKMLTSMMDSDLWSEYYSGAAGESVATLAMTKIGCKYDQSRRMEEGYYDCSSLVYRLYKEVGIELPYVADTQGEYCFKNAMLVNKEDLKPGDLIFYSDEVNGCFRNITHVAIYVGDGMMVHAAGKARGVVLDPMRETNVVFYARPYK